MSEMLQLNTYLYSWNMLQALPSSHFKWSFSYASTQASNSFVCGQFFYPVFC